MLFGSWNWPPLGQLHLGLCVVLVNKSIHLSFLCGFLMNKTANFIHWKFAMKITIHTHKCTHNSKREKGNTIGVCAHLFHWGVGGHSWIRSVLETAPFSVMSLGPLEPSPVWVVWEQLSTRGLLCQGSVRGAGKKVGGADSNQGVRGRHKCYSLWALEKLYCCFSRMKLKDMRYWE